MRAAGMPEGKSILGGLAEGREVIVEDGVAKMPDRSCFAGSVATTDRLVRTMVQIAGCSVVDAVKMMTVNPARFMGLTARKGTIAPGKDADIVIFDDDIRVSHVLVGGRRIV
jgi:N-acetylglucosamine-6-phosphate deacetylase